MDLFLQLQLRAVIYEKQEDKLSLMFLSLLIYECTYYGLHVIQSHRPEWIKLQVFLQHYNAKDSEMS